MLGFSLFSRDWKGMREMERKEEVLVWHFISKSEDLMLFGERIWGGERKEEDLVRAILTRSSI